MIIIQDKVRTGSSSSLCGLSIKEKNSFLLCCCRFFSLFIFFNIFLRRKKRPPSDCQKSCLPSPCSPWFLPVVWRTAGVTGTVDYGMDCKTSVMFRGGGTDCSALHGNQVKALSVELNLHSKSPYGADYHTWERKR